LTDPLEPLDAAAEIDPAADIDPASDDEEEPGAESAAPRTQGLVARGAHDDSI
jgi:hypothetical protein